MQRASALEGQTTFGRRRGEAVSRVALVKAGRASVSVRYHEFLAALRHGLRARKDMGDKLTGTLLHISKLIEHSGMGVGRTNPENLTNLSSKVAHLRNGMDVKKLEL